jgi:hypothetical protein
LVVLSRASSVALLLALELALPDVGSRARADPQVSARMGMGAGKRFAEVLDQPIFTTVLRSEALFGAPEPRRFRIGPALELRTADFASLEAALGGSIAIPMPGDFPLGLTGLLGYGARRQAPDAPVGIATLTWGYRGYNYHSWYGYGLNVFVSARRDLSGEPLAEITGGIEVDLAFVALVPILGVRNVIASEDPDEPAR